MNKQQTFTEHESTLMVPESLTIFTVQDTAKQWLAHSSYRYLDFSKCEELDGAGVGLLISLITSTGDNLPNLQFIHVSEEIAAVLGLFGEALFNNALFTNELANNTLGNNTLINHPIHTQDPL